MQWERPLGLRGDEMQASLPSPLWEGVRGIALGGWLTVVILGALFSWIGSLFIGVSTNQELLAADSKGTYAQDHILHCYAYQRVHVPDGPEDRMRSATQRLGVN